MRDGLRVRSHRVMLLIGEVDEPGAQAREDGFDEGQSILRRSVLDQDLRPFV